VLILGSATASSFRGIPAITTARPSDPDKLFNAGLEGAARRAIDFFEGDKINERALRNLVRSAVDYNQIKLKKKAATGARTKVHKNKET
jgi:hypothetical protein